MKTQQKKFGVIGYGRFGKLLAEELSSLGTVRVYDTRRITSISRSAQRIQFAPLSETVAADIVFLAVPISRIEQCCKKISPLLKPHVIVADTCSVKVYPARVMNMLLPKHSMIIATHPLFGPDSAKKGGVKNKSIVVCPVRASKEAKKTFNSILMRLGLRVIQSSASQHDQAMARSQAIVHLIGRGLLPLRLRANEISTPDYASLLAMQEMVRHDSWQLFLDMQRYNPYARAVRKKFLQSLRVIESSLTPSH